MTDIARVLTMYGHCMNFLNNNREYSPDIMAAMLVFLEKYILLTFFVWYTNMATMFIVN